MFHAIHEAARSARRDTGSRLRWRRRDPAHLRIPGEGALRPLGTARTPDRWLPRTKGRVRPVPDRRRSPGAPCHITARSQGARRHAPCPAATPAPVSRGAPMTLKNPRNIPPAARPSTAPDLPPHMRAKRVNPSAPFREGLIFFAEMSQNIPRQQLPQKQSHRIVVFCGFARLTPLPHAPKVPRRNEGVHSVDRLVLIVGKWRMGR